MVGFGGVMNKLPSIIQDLIHIHYHKILHNRDTLLPAAIVLSLAGIVTAFTSIYEIVKLSSRNLARRLGDQVLEVQ